MGKTEELLAMYRVIEFVKDAIQQFEDGDINVREAVQIIRDATLLSRAA